LHLQNFYCVSSFKLDTESITAAISPHKMTQHDSGMPRVVGGLEPPIGNPNFFQSSCYYNVL